MGQEFKYQGDKRSVKMEPENKKSVALHESPKSSTRLASKTHIKLHFKAICSKKY